MSLGCQGPALKSGGRVGADLGGAWRGEASQGAGRTERADSNAGGSPALQSDRSGWRAMEPVASGLECSTLRLWLGLLLLCSWWFPGSAEPRAPPEKIGRRGRGGALRAWRERAPRRAVAASCCRPGARDARWVARNQPAANVALFPVRASEPLVVPPGNGLSRAWRHAHLRNGQWSWGRPGPVRGRAPGVPAAAVSGAWGSKEAKAPPAAFACCTCSEAGPLAARSYWPVPLCR